MINLSQKREEIIASTALLMRSTGYENTKLSDILDKTQIGKGQFYHYFSSKHELGLAVIDYFFRDWNERLLENILGSGKAPEIKFDEMLEWVIRRHSSLEDKCGCVFGNFALEMSEHDEEFRQRVKLVFDEWTNKLKPVLAGMIKVPNQVEPDEVDKMAWGVVAMLEGGILLMKNKQDIQVLINTIDTVRFLVNAFVQSNSVKKTASS